ncbi:MAG: hypothetical protein ABI607_15420 [Betaproteobacteria bacterium]
MNWNLADLGMSNITRSRCALNSIVGAAWPKDPIFSFPRRTAMQVTLMEQSIYVHPQFPVELAISVDGTAIRVAIEWRAIERLMGAASANEEQVRSFLHSHRTEIGLAIQARLAAQGTPLSRKLAMSPEDFPLVGTVRRPPADVNRSARDGFAEGTRPVAGATPSARRP